MKRMVQDLEEYGLVNFAGTLHVSKECAMLICKSPYGI